MVLPAAVNVTAQRPGLADAAISLQVLPRPVLFVHGIWSDNEALANVSSFVIANGNYVDITIDSNAGNCAAKLESGAVDTCTEKLVSPIIRTCYAPDLAFDAPSGPGGGCDKASVDAVADDLQTIYSYLDNEGVVGGRVDFVAHSMGGLVARHFAVASDSTMPYLGVRDRGLGKFYSVLTIDTPELGSALADTLIADANLHPDLRGKSPDAAVVWTAARCTGSDTLASCYRKFRHPLSYDGDDPYYTHGSAYSLQTIYPGIADRRRNPLVIANTLHGAISAVFDDTSYIALAHPISASTVTAMDSSCSLGICTVGPIRPSILRASVQGFLDAVSPTPVTVTELLQGLNDVIVNVDSQVGGGVKAQPIPGLAHSGLGWMDATALSILLQSTQIFPTGYSDDNVMNSSTVNGFVLCWLVSVMDCNSVAKSPAANQTDVKHIQLITSSDGNEEVRRGHTALAENAPLGGPTSQTETIRSGRTIRDVSDRVQVTHPTSGTTLGKSFKLRLQFRENDPLMLSVDQEVESGRRSGKELIDGSQKQLQLLHDEEGKYVEVVPLRLGNVTFRLTAVFAEGGLMHKDVLVAVNPPSVTPSRFWTAGGTKALRLERKQTFTLEPFASYAGSHEPFQIGAPFVRFRIETASGAQVVSVNEITGLVTPIAPGSALIRAFFGGLKTSTCVIVLAGSSGIDHKHANCEDVLGPSEKLPYMRPQVVER